VTHKYHDVVLRTVRDNPELPSGLVVDGVEMMVPRGASVQIDVATDSVTTLTFTIYAGSLRVEHVDESPRG
jgi:hypothetical protein